MATVGFLHTSPVHGPVFDALVAELADAADRVAVVSRVEVGLLDDARRVGPDDPTVVSGIESALRGLIEAGAERIVCTCSTIGGEAESAGRRLGVDVARVDRAMAESAVASGGDVHVLAALTSTLGPTLELLASAATAAGTDPRITATVVDGAWERFEAGDLDGYHALVADAIVRAGGGAGDGGGDDGDGAAVVLLAQASMAPAAELVEVDVIVLSSPRLAVARLLNGPSAAPGP